MCSSLLTSSLINLQHSIPLYHNMNLLVYREHVTQISITLWHVDYLMHNPFVDMYPPMAQDDNLTGIRVVKTSEPLSEVVEEVVTLDVPQTSKIHIIDHRLPLIWHVLAH